MARWKRVGGFSGSLPTRLRVELVLASVGALASCFHNPTRKRGWRPKVWLRKKTQQRDRYCVLVGANFQADWLVEQASSLQLNLANQL